MPRITKADVEGKTAAELKTMLTNIIASDPSPNDYSKEDIEVLRRLIEKKLTSKEMVALAIEQLNL